MPNHISLETLYQTGMHITLQLAAIQSISSTQMLEKSAHCFSRGYVYLKYQLAHRLLTT